MWLTRPIWKGGTRLENMSGGIGAHVGRRGEDAGGAMEVGGSKKSRTAISTAVPE
jgi:hypothetical protein